MIEALFDHRVDIYRPSELSGNNFGLPTTDLIYSDTPEVENEPCHIGKDINVSQGSPMVKMHGTIPITFSVLTDVRTNDRVVDRETGIKYKVYFPRNVRGNHIRAMLEVDDNV